MKPSGSPPTQATLRAASRIASIPPTRGVEPADATLAVQRQREAGERRAQTQHRGVETRPAHRPRLHELVVAARDERARAQLRRAEQLQQRLARRRKRGRLLGRRGAGGALDLVARALRREEPRRDRTDLLAVPERAQDAGVGDLADDRPMELPAVDHRLDLGQPVVRDDGHHPLLRLGDHHLPGLHPLLAQRHAVEVHVDAGLGGHLGEARGQPGGAAVLQREHEAPLDELHRHLDQPLAGERVAHLHGGPLVGVALGEVGAREHRGAADPVTPGRRAVDDDVRADGRGLARASAARPAGGRRTSR